MKAVDVMTSPVISVTPETTVREIAALLFERRISGLPVVENGELVGMVSEADLLHRHEIGTDCIGRTGSWWLRLFSQERSMEHYIRSHAVKARDIMSRDVVSVAEDTPLADIATLLETRGFKRVPVLRDVPLARALVELEVGDEIPEALYEAVAEILREAWDEAAGSPPADGR